MNTQIKYILKAIALMTLILGGINMLNAGNIYDYEVESISGEKVSLEQYRGKALLIVNTASKCGFTKQYDGLQELYTQYKDRGLVVLGFPANNFMNQEPGSNQEIGEFCRLNYGVSFPMFAKISVRGKYTHPLYEYLTGKDSNPDFRGKISWNFTKFLVSKDGRIIKRFAPATAPQDKEVLAAIEAALR